MFLRPSGSSIPPAMEASLPKTLVSPCHRHPCALAVRMKIEAGGYGNLAADGGSLPLVLRAQRLHGLGQLHLDLGRSREYCRRRL